MKIAFFDSKEYDVDNFKRANKDYGFDIRYFYDRLNENNADLAKGYDAVCVFVNDRLFEKTLEHLAENGVKLVALRCAGFNNVDLEAAGKLGITVVNAPEYSPQGIAEHTLGLILSLNRKIHKAYIRTKEYNFSLRGLMGFNMQGKTVGIVGLGKIGQSTAKLLKAFGCRLLAFDLYPNQQFVEENGIILAPLEKLWAESDIITFHCPLTKETRHMVNRESINMMKDGVMIINTSRGALIDTRALINGIKAHKIGTVGLDVYEEEAEYFFEDFTDSILEDSTLLELLALPNVLVTSHQAYFTTEALAEISKTTLENIKQFEAKAPLKYEVKQRKQ